MVDPSSVVGLGKDLWQFLVFMPDTGAGWRRYRPEQSSEANTRTLWSTSSSLAIDQRL